MARKPPNPIDVHVGARLRMRRVFIGLSQEKLGAMLGLTFQQIQKYEKGTNRIGASRLYMISQALSAPVSFFFDGLMSGGVASAEGAKRATETAIDIDRVASPEGVQLNSAFFAIRDAKLRKHVLDLLKALSKDQDIHSETNLIQLRARAGGKRS
jgi:transcriptional regulator with XRE-family HTH domain